jgi:hypothetical protein
LTSRTQDGSAPGEREGRVNTCVAWLAWVLCALTLVMIACAVALAVLNDYDLRRLAFLVAEATAALVGGLIASRRPRNPVGWLIIGHALCFSLGEFSRQYTIYGLLTDPGSLPLARVMASPPYWAWYPGLVLISLLSLYFPNGRLVSRRWRPVVWLAAFGMVVLTVIAAVQPGSGETQGIPNPLGIEGLESLRSLSGVLEVAIPASWLALGAASVASLVLRFRRSRGEEQQQIKWVAYAAVLQISFAMADILFLESILPSVVNDVLFVLAFEGLWVAIAVAILRYRLYEIDRIINRTLVYGALTASLVLFYFGSIVLLQALFRALTGQESQLAIVASTLAIAALFNPLRRRIQAFIDRRFYRRKYDAAKTLEAFSARLRDETHLGTLSEDLVGVVRETMQPTHASLWLRPPDEIGGDGERVQSR